MKTITTESLFEGIKRRSLLIDQFPELEQEFKTITFEYIQEYVDNLSSGK